MAARGAAFSMFREVDAKERKRKKACNKPENQVGYNYINTGKSR